MLKAAPQVVVAEAVDVKLDDNIREAVSKSCSSIVSKTDQDKTKSRCDLSKVKNPIKISFKDVNFTVKVPTTKQEQADGYGTTKWFPVLKNCTGYANPGEALYIMGASGAGKTSLMNVLSDRISTNKSKIL